MYCFRGFCAFSAQHVVLLRPYWRKVGSREASSLPNLFSALNGRPVRADFNIMWFRVFHSSKHSGAWEKDKPLENQIVVRDNHFAGDRTKDKSSFLLVLETYTTKNTLRSRHVEFIYTAMKHLEEFGVQADLDVYKSLMSVFPEGRFVPQNRWQVAFFHFPKHQQCAIDLLDKMEMHGVCPDVDMKKIIVDRFGDRTDVYKKYARMIYWFPKFKHLSPFPLPETMPRESLELAKLAIKRMMVDPQSLLTIYQTESLADSLDKTWIVSGQSPLQQDLISNQKDNVPFYVEGPFFVWLRQFSITYFMLRADNTRIETSNEDEDPDDITTFESVILNPSKVKSIMNTESVHEQEDGIVLALCATGTSSRDSLLSWIRFLQETNPKLKSNPVLFTLKAPSEALTTVNKPPRE